MTIAFKYCTLLFAFVLIVSGESFSQSQFIDVIYLQNGGLYKGKIVSEDSSRVLVEIYGGSVIPVYNADILRKERQEADYPYALPKELYLMNKPEKNDTVRNYEGVGMLADFGLSLGNVSGFGSGVYGSLTFGAYYRWLNGFQLGMASGLEGFEGVMIPLTLDARYYRGQAGKVQPGFYARQSVTVHDYFRYNGQSSLGSLSEIGLGFKVQMASRFAMGMHVTTSYLFIKSENAWWGGSELVEYSVFRPGVKLNFFF